MYLKRSSTMLLLVAFVLLVGLLAGCGGGDQSGSGAQSKDKQGESAKKKASKVKIAVGTITGVKGEKRRIIVLKPTEEVQGGNKMVFRIRKNADITLGDKEAELADIKEGQQAQIRYVQKNERNRASIVTLFEGGETPPSEEGEEPSKGGEKTG